MKRKLLATVKEYMKKWMFVQEREDIVIIKPAVGKLAGFYPEDFTEVE